MVTRTILLALVLGSVTLAQPDTAWVRRYDGPGHNWDEPDVMKLVGDRIYVGGQSRGDGTGYDYATVVYDLAGNELWSARYNGPGNDRDDINDLVVDHEGNVIVTGTSETSSVNGWATIKYDPSGDTLWLRRRDVDGGAAAVAIDDSGNVFVSGSAGSYPNSRLQTVRYGPDGTEHWVREYYPPAPNRVNTPRAMAVDANGCPIVAGGGTRDSTGHDILVIKYDPVTGESLWVARYSGPIDGGDAAGAIVLDDSGNIYLTGWFDTDSTGRDIITMKYDPDGTLLWLDIYDGPGNGSDEGRDIELDDGGNVYVFGNAYRASSNTDFAVIKYSPAGDMLWVRLYNYPSNRTQVCYAGAVDSDGSVYVCGYLWTGTSYDYLTVKYDTDGNEQWYVRYNTYERQEDEAYDIALDDSGFVYVTGRAKDSITDFDYATIKYDQQTGIRQRFGPRIVETLPGPTLVRGTLRLRGRTQGVLLDVSGRQAAVLVPGLNDIRHLAPGIYFLRSAEGGTRSAVRKVVIQR